MTRTGKDQDNPPIIDFEGQDWHQQDDTWIPGQNNAPTMNKAKADPIHAQSDSGANRIVTDNLSILRNVRQIEPYPMGGCNKDDPAAIICTATGDLQLESIDGTKIIVKAYYSEQVDGTIISPTTIVVQHKDRYVGC